MRWIGNPSPASAVTGRKRHVLGEGKTPFVNKRGFPLPQAPTSFPKKLFSGIAQLEQIGTVYAKMFLAVKNLTLISRGYLYDALPLVCRNRHDRPTT